MIAGIFNTIGQVITSFAGVLGNGFTAMLALFWNTEGPTTLGILSLIGLGMGLVYWGFALVRSLIPNRRG